MLGSFFQKAKSVLQGLSLIFPDRVSLEVHEFSTRDEFMTWLPANRDAIGAPGHRSSPFVWFEPGHVLGGCDDTIAWAKATFASSSDDIVAVPLFGSCDDTIAWAKATFASSSDAASSSAASSSTPNNVDAWNANVIK